MSRRSIPILDGAFTVMVVYECEPTQSEEFAAGLAKFIAAGMRRHPGFLSALVYLSEDGRRVVEHFQWVRAEDWAAYRISDEGREALHWMGRRHPEVHYLELVQSIVTALPESP
jgi:heme-degrading monooxygenase HmoA